MKKVIIKKLILISLMLSVFFYMSMFTVNANSYEDTESVAVDVSSTTTNDYVSYRKYGNINYNSVKQTSSTENFKTSEDAVAVLRIGLGGVNISGKQIRYHIKGSTYGRIQFGFMNADGNTVFVKRSDNGEGGNFNKFLIYNDTKSFDLSGFQTSWINYLGIRYDINYGDCYIEMAATSGNGTFKGYNQGDGNTYGYKICTGFDWTKIDTALIEFPTTVAQSFDIFSIEVKENDVWEKLFDASNGIKIDKPEYKTGTNPTEAGYEKNEYSFDKRPMYSTPFNDTWFTTIKIGAGFTLKNNSNLATGDWTKAPILQGTLDNTNALCLNVNTKNCETFNVHFIFRQNNNSSNDYIAEGNAYYVDEKGVISMVENANIIKPDFVGKLYIPYSSFKKGNSSLDSVTGLISSYLFFAWDTYSIETTRTFSFDDIKFVNLKLEELTNEYNNQLFNAALNTFKKSFIMGSGASIRLSENYGIRFISTIEKSALDELNIRASAINAKYKLGMLITANDLLNGAVLDKEFPGTVADIEITKWASENKFTVALTEIKQENLNREFIAVAYLTITYEDDSTQTIYASGSINTVRSIYAVAKRAISDYSEGTYEYNKLSEIISLSEENEQEAKS